ncbi:tetratricopeptide repeat protein [Mycobacterium hubeiense]|uniref:tetratricopeptide repeat protein n=1 Tax=Mycobacterium hubeiense TaxID=1867256 RepID=UPI0018EDB8D6|nr:tetratricopeptide repeat protein [Mycobacterium sp. QGD 101]
MPVETIPDQGELSESTPEVDVADSGETAEHFASPEDESVVVDAPDETRSAKPRMSHVRWATIAGFLLVVALGGLTGWLGYRAYQSHQTEEQRNLFVQVGRQGAVNLTTIDWQHADRDVHRILDSATGTFYDDFQKRSGPFIDVVKKAQSKSEGKVTEAALESGTDDHGQVLVAVTVNTSNAGAPEQQPRSWRMRITVQKVDDEAKVSNVEFVP